jgi:TetR/AcrR family transcriptional regulator, repressor for uid operon
MGSLDMPKLKPETQALRRDHILDVAERCFAYSGFHRTTMQDICREAEISPGALYGHFDGKEALIEGLCERDRAEFAQRFSVLAQATDFLAALEAIGRNVFLEEPAHKRLFAAELAVESTRNPRIAHMYQTVDTFVFKSFEALFTRLKDEGRIAPANDIPEVARVFQLIGDGLLLRRAVHADFDFLSVRNTILAVAEKLLNPTDIARADPARPSMRLVETSRCAAKVSVALATQKPVEVQS